MLVAFIVAWHMFWISLFFNFLILAFIHLIYPSSDIHIYIMSENSFDDILVPSNQSKYNKYLS